MTNQERLDILDEERAVVLIKWAEKEIKEWERFIKILKDNTPGIDAKSKKLKDKKVKK